MRGRSRQAKLADAREELKRYERLWYRAGERHAQAEVLIRWALEGGLDPEDVAPALNRETELLLWDLVFDLGLPFQGGAR